MIEKGRSNNKSLYVILTVVLLALAGTAYGVFNMFFKEEAPKVDNKSVAKVETTQATPEKAEAKQETAKADTKTAEKQEPAKVEAKTEKAVEKKAAAIQPDDYTILIKKSEFKLYVLKKGAVVESYGIALGKNKGDKEKAGDMKTPNGTFKVIEVCDASYWTHDFKDGKGEIKGAYGPWFLYLDTTAKSKGNWDGIGIHGTHDPSSIGTLASEGCIRVLNENIQTLKSKYVTVGTQVTIEE